MSTLTSIATMLVQGVDSTNRETASNTWTDDVLHAYRQEFQLTGAEDEVVWDTADDPNYSDFVLFRVEVLDWGANAVELVIRVTAGADSMEFAVSKYLPVFELPSMDVWNDNSDSGSPDTIDEIKLMGTGGVLSGTPIPNPVRVRITAYTVAS